MDLWVDDCKPCPEGMAVARTFEDAVGLLQRFDYDTVYLDHDLGDAGTATGYDLLCAIEAGTLRRPKRIELITWNPVGRQKMLACLKRMEEHDD